MVKPSVRDWEMAHEVCRFIQINDPHWLQPDIPLASIIAAAREEGRVAAAADAEALVRSTCAEAIERAREEGRREPRTITDAMVEVAHTVAYNAGYRIHVDIIRSMLVVAETQGRTENTV